MYSLPSSSHTCEPSPRSMKMGLPPTARNARTGEFTPPGITCCARLKSSSDLDIRQSEDLRQFQRVIRNQDVGAGTLNCSRRFQNDAFALNPARASSSFD